MLAVVQPYSAATPDVAHCRATISSGSSSRSASTNLAPNPPPSLQRTQTAPPRVPSHPRVPTPPPKQPEDDGSPFDINTYPPTDLLKLLALLLTHIATTNDPLAVGSSGSASHAPQPPPEPADAPPIWHSLTTASRNAVSTPAATLTFHARNIPTIALEAYLMRILKYCPTSNHVFLSLLVYFDRMSKLSEEAVGRAFVIDSYNIHRLVIAGVTVASKFFSDVFYTNSRYAKVGGLPLPELNQLELQFLLLNDFRLVITSTEMQHYAEQLILFSKSTSSHTSFVSKASSTVRLPSSSPLVPPSSTSTSAVITSTQQHAQQNGHVADHQDQQKYSPSNITSTSSLESQRPQPYTSAGDASSSSSSTIIASTPHPPQSGARSSASPQGVSTPPAYPNTSSTSPHGHPSSLRSPPLGNRSRSESSTSTSSVSYTTMSSEGPPRPLDALGGAPPPVHNPYIHPAYLPQTHPPHSRLHSHAHQPPHGYINGGHNTPQQRGTFSPPQAHTPTGGLVYPPQAYYPTPGLSSASSSSGSFSPHRPPAPVHSHSFSSVTTSSSGADGDAEDDTSTDADTDAGTETSTDDEPTVRAPGTVCGSVWGGDDDEHDRRIELGGEQQQRQDGRRRSFSSQGQMQREREDALMRSP